VASEASFGEGLLYRHGERCTIVPDVSWFHTLFTQSQLRRLESVPHQPGFL